MNDFIIQFLSTNTIRNVLYDVVVSLLSWLLLYVISKGIWLLKTKVKLQSQKGDNKCMVKSVPTWVLHKTYKEFPRDNIQIEEFSIQIPKNLKH